MIRSFNSDLSQLSIYANGNELPAVMARDTDTDGNRVYEMPDRERELLAVFENPVLMTNNWRINQLDAKTRYAINNILGWSKKWTEYTSIKGPTTSLLFEQQKHIGVRGPSIDTVSLLQGIDLLSDEHIKRVAGIGMGAGLEGKHVLNTMPGVEQVDFVDINPRARDCREVNIKDPRAEFHVTSSQEYFKHLEKPLDLIVSNPPYIPRPKSIDDNPYEGVSMMVDLIHNFDTYTTENGVLVLNYSHLCDSHVQQAVMDKGLTIETLTSKSVPLKVCNIINNPDWMNYLINQKGLQVTDHPGHPYRHTISVVAIRRAS